MTVWSLTPSRMAIISTRRTYSKLLFEGWKAGGVSLGKFGYLGGGVWAIADALIDVIRNTSFFISTLSLQGKPIESRFGSQSSWWSRLRCCSADVAFIDSIRPARPNLVPGGPSGERSCLE